MNDTALATIEPPQTVVPMSDNPGVLMRQATDVAGVCREIVLRTACNIQGRKYVKCEGWMAIATAHGCIASSRSVERVEGGWTAIGEIRRISDGVLLSQAEGFVGKDEKRWGQADEYACRAMAQTRAISRACRAAFAHVVVLIDGGLSTTPAEEVPDGGFDNAPRRAMPVLKPVTTPLAPALTPPVTFKTAAERKARLDAFLLKCKLKLVSDLEKGDPAAAIEFMQKAGHLMPNESLADANELTVFASVPHEPADKETDGDWWARVNEAVAKDALAIKQAFEAFQQGDQIPGAEVPDAAEEDQEPLPDGCFHLLIDVCSVSDKSGASKKGPWTLTIVRDENGHTYTTFDKKIAEKAKALSGAKATVFFTTTDKGNNLHKIIPV